MHRCLQIPEIQRMICDQLKDEAQDHNHDPVIKHALAALARTCISWSAVALDGLWSRIFGLSPLIKCMPRDLWQAGNGNTIFRRPLRGSDLEVLQKYTPRVQELLILHSTCEAMLDSKACQILLMVFSRHPLLPNLRKLVWESTICHLFPIIPLFLTNKLKILRLAVPQSNMERIEQHTLLAVTLPSLAPEITHLTLLTRDITSFERVGLSEAIRQWHEMSTLDIGQWNISPDDLLCIASMTKLTSLNLRSLPAFHRLTNSGDLPLLGALANLRPPFPALQHLSLSDDRQESLLNITKFLEVLHGASLSTLSIDGGTGETNLNHLLELFGKIESHCNHGTLRKIHLKASINARSAIPFSIFSPLLQFTALEAVRLHVYPSITIVEDEASQIASSWSRLHTLELFPPGFLSQPRQGTKTTLSSLLPLARACVNLDTLYIYLDASDSNTHKLLVEHPETFKGIRNRSLRTLGVGQSWIKNKEFVAIFLSEIFPHVKILNNFLRHEDTRHCRRWNYVDGVLLPLIRGAWRRENEYLGVKNSVVGQRRLVSAERSDLLEEEDESYISFGWCSD